MPDKPTTPGPEHFDLRTEEWVPVSGDGSRTVGLRELFLDAHHIGGLAIALPPAASGLLRVLYAITARITGLWEVEGREWYNRRYGLLARSGDGFEPAAVEAYFTRYATRFRLHDPDRPWLQDPRLRAECPGGSGVNKLVMARPAGNNQIWFGHFTDDEQIPLASGDAALHLLAQLYYGPSGQCTPRTVAGQRFGNAYAGPLRKVLSYHPVGRSLYETLLLGLPGPGTFEDGRAERGRAADQCPWERDELPNPLAPPPAPAGPLSALTEQYRHAVLLTPGADGRTVVDATITWAIRANRPPYEDPYVLWDEGKDGTRRPREADANRALWRDLDALVNENRGGEGGHRPRILTDLNSQLPRPVADSLRVHALGFDQDGQTRDRTYFTAATPPLFNLLNPAYAADNELRLDIREGRESAEKAAYRLESALQNAWRAYTTPFEGEKPGGTAKDRRKRGGPWPALALGGYWPKAEQLFWSALEARDFTDSLRSFGRLALVEYDAVTAQVAATPRGAKACEGARGLVRSLLRTDRAATSGLKSEVGR
ncbi:type I-E CRISPR-associated protein Cse1/CasA [Streptomyces sp. NBC_01511]